MDQRSEPVLPDPWHDPEFSRVRGDHKPVGDSRSGLHCNALGRSSPPGWPGARTLFLILVLASVWLGLLLDPMLGPIMLSLLMAVGLTLAVVVAAMGLGWMGIGLFAAGDRVIGWFRESTQWPED